MDAWLWIIGTALVAWVVIMVATEIKLAMQDNVKICKCCSEEIQGIGFKVRGVGSGYCQQCAEGLWRIIDGGKGERQSAAEDRQA